IEEQAQSLTDKTSMAFQHEKMPPTLFSASPPGGATIPPPTSCGSSLPWYDASTHYGGPPMMPTMGPPPPGMMPVGPASGMRPLVGGHVPMMPRHPHDETSRPSHDGAHSARNDLTRQIRREGALFIFSLHYLFFTRRSWCCDSGCFLTA
uniref:Uncharacterized protein n=1 Tax=Lynx canadensis TaxID=61383 RepID=A0A667IBP3_LYNCA